MRVDCCSPCSCPLAPPCLCADTVAVAALADPLNPHTAVAMLRAVNAAAAAVATVSANTANATTLGTSAAGAPAHPQLNQRRAQQARQAGGMVPPATQSALFANTSFVQGAAGAGAVPFAGVGLATPTLAQQGVLQSTVQPGANGVAASAVDPAGPVDPGAKRPSRSARRKAAKRRRRRLGLMPYSTGIHVLAACPCLRLDP